MKHYGQNIQQETQLQYLTTDFEKKEMHSRLPVRDTAVEHL